MHRTSFVVFLAVSLLSTIRVAPAAATNGGAAVAMAAGGRRAPLVITAESDSGALVIDEDSRNGTRDLYSQRLDARGRTLLGESGTYLLTADPLDYSMQFLADGAGGIILAQSMARGASGRDIVVWRVGPDGAMAFGANGIVVCSAARDQQQPRLVAGPAGYFFVVWTDDRANLGTSYDIYGQKLSLAGMPQWGANGLLLTASSLRPVSYSIGNAISDMQGGMILTWNYNNSNFASRAQRVNANGAPLWTASGLEFGDPPYGISLIVPDGLGGAWGVIPRWNGTTNSPYAYHVTASGAPAFAGGVHYAPDAPLFTSSLVRNATGGCTIYSLFGSSGQSFYSIYRQELSSSGALLRGTYGDDLGTGTALPIVTDGGDCYFTYVDEAELDSPRRRRRIQKYALDGTPAYAGAGVVLGREEGTWPYSMYIPVMARNAAGGVTVAWSDSRYVTLTNPDAFDVFGQSYGSSGAPLWTDAEQPTLLTVRDAASDQGGFVRATWTASVADHPGARTATGYRVWRALPGSVAASLAARPAGNGMFRSGGRTLLALASSYWELAGEQPAATLPSYALTVATGLDSTAASPADQSFMVEAFDDSSHHWFSGALTGHSVDNLAPGMVPAAAGYYVSGSTTLYWGGVPDADLASYEIFRGGTPAFTPGDANRIASTNSVTWNDPYGGPAVYRIAARDIHGNLGPSALVMAGGTLGVDGSAPRAWRLRAASEAGEVALSLDVPLADRGRVELFDVSGRRVWESEFRTESAQALAFHAPARDWPAGIVFARVTSASGPRLEGRVVVLR